MGLRYTKVLLLRLKQLQRGEWLPEASGGYKGFASIGQWPRAEHEERRQPGQRRAAQPQKSKRGRSVDAEAHADLQELHSLDG